MYFDSNKQETMKKQLYPSDSSNFLPLHWRNPAKCFDPNASVYMYFLRL